MGADLSRDHGKNPRRKSRSLVCLGNAHHHQETLGRKLVNIVEILDLPEILLQDIRLEGPPLVGAAGDATVRVRRFMGNRSNLPSLDQILQCFQPPTGIMFLPVLVFVEKGLGVPPSFAPVCAQDDERIAGHRTIHLLPFLDIRELQLVVGILGGLSGDVDHISLKDELVHGDGFHQPHPLVEMARRVEMGSILTDVREDLDSSTIDFFSFGLGKTFGDGDGRRERVGEIDERRCSRQDHRNRSWIKAE